MKASALLDISLNLVGRMPFHLSMPLHKSLDRPGQVALRDPVLELDDNSRRTIPVPAKERHAFRIMMSLPQFL
jgi:hypothetical protein